MGNPNLVFFIGSHRTGSKSLANFFHSDVCDTVSIHQRRSQQWLNLLSNMYIAGRLGERSYRYIVKKLLVDWVRRQNRENIVETNGFNMAAVELVLADYPDASVVHVVRDPRTFIRSQINFRLQAPLKRQLQLNMPYWELKAHYAGEMDVRDWNGLTEAEQLAWQWRVKNAYIIDHLSSSRKYLQVRFEELFDPDSEVFSRVLEYCGLDCHKAHIQELYGQYLNSPEKKTFESWQKWDNALALSVHNICGDMMSRFGYGNEPEWKGRVG